ncbi:hypothetical protein BDL97_02G146900 [Sphagnum fallax]|nr:hypothetical protein BDL97_02G146900 [Sphagnum fallax]
MLHVNLGLSDSSNYEFYVPENPEFTKISQRECFFFLNVTLSLIVAVQNLENLGVSVSINYGFL